MYGRYSEHTIAFVVGACYIVNEFFGIDSKKNSCLCYCLFHCFVQLIKAEKMDIDI